MLHGTIGTGSSASAVAASPGANATGGRPARRGLRRRRPPRRTRPIPARPRGRARTSRRRHGRSARRARPACRRALRRGTIAPAGSRTATSSRAARARARASGRADADRSSAARAECGLRERVRDDRVERALEHGDGVDRLGQRDVVQPDVQRRSPSNHVPPQAPATQRSTSREVPSCVERRRDGPAFLDSASRSRARAPRRRARMPRRARREGRSAGTGADERAAPLQASSRGPRIASRGTAPSRRLPPRRSSGESRRDRGGAARSFVRAGGAAVLPRARARRRTRRRRGAARAAHRRSAAGRRTTAPSSPRETHARARRPARPGAREDYLRAVGRDPRRRSKRTGDPPCVLPW